MNVILQQLEPTEYFHCLLHLHAKTDFSCSTLQLLSAAAAWIKSDASVKTKIHLCTHIQYTQMHIKDDWQLLVYQEKKRRVWSWPCLNWIFVKCGSMQGLFLCWSECLDLNKIPVSVTVRSLHLNSEDRAFCQLFLIYHL